MLAPLAEFKVEAVLRENDHLHLVYDIENMRGSGLVETRTTPVAAGLDVEVALAGVRVRFPNVEPGVGNVMGVVRGVPVLPPNDSLRSLPGIANGDAGTDIFTSAAFTGPVTVSLHYPADNLTPAQQEQVRMYQLKRDGVWEDITISAGAGLVAGRTDGFSIFALFIATSAIPPEVPVFNPPGPASVVSVTSSTIQLAWAPNGNPPDTQFDVFYGADVSSGALKARFTGFGGVLTGLSSATPYQIQVCRAAACNLILPSAERCGAPIAATTDPGQPPPGSGVSASGLAIAIDPSGHLWEVAREGTVFKLGRFSPSGIFQGSVVLPGATDNASWSVGFDDSGHALAIGSVLDSAGTDVDLGVFRVSPEGTSLVSSATFNSEFGKSDISLDATGDAWITGAILTEGSFDSGIFKVVLGLWRYCPHNETIKLITTYGRGAGLDAGFGIRLVGEDIWISGFSQNPAPAPGTAPLDLALWKFSKTGALLAGPFLRPGYALGVEGDLTAKLEVSPAGLFVAASRAGPGASQLAFLKYDFSGNLLIERHWDSPLGEYPRGIALNAQGDILVAGQVQGNQSEEAVLWKYGADGSFVNAQLLAGQGNARGVAVAGQEAWLAVGASSSPYRFAGGAAVAGNDMLISSASSPGPADTTAPVTTILVNGLGISSATAVLASTDIVSFAASDAGTGVRETRYSLDGGIATIFTAAFSLAAGTRTLAFQSVDRAGNTEPVKMVSILWSEGRAFPERDIGAQETVRGRGR